MAARELTDEEVFGGRELSDADVFGAAPPVGAPRLPPGPRFGMGRGNAPTRAPLRVASVLQQPGIAEDFAAAPDPRANAMALFNALQTNPDAAKSPMYRAGAAALQEATTGEPGPVQSTMRTARAAQLGARQRQKRIVDAREQTDQAFGGPVGQAVAAPGRRLAAGVAQVVGGVASVPQLFGSDLGSDTSEAAALMAGANMPEDPGIADEVLAGAGQLLPMIGGAGAVRALTLPLLGEAGATGLATTLSGAAGGAMTGGEVLRDLEDRFDLSPEEKRRRALLSAAFSALTSKYADRFLIPGADKAATGPLNAGMRALFAEGAQEGLDQAGQNVATDRPLGQGVGRAALIGGLVGGGARVASDVSSPDFQLAQAIDADANAFANAPRPPTIWAPSEARVAPPMAPSPAPAPAPVPALPYDPSVKAGPDIMVAGQDGTARPMTADEFLEAEDTREQVQAKELSDAEIGLTPDVKRAQEARTEPAGDVKVEPDLVQRLMAAGWQPPKDTNASKPGGGDQAAAPDQDTARQGPAPAGDAAPDGAARADGVRAGQPDAALSPGPVPAPPPAAAPVAQVTASTAPAAVAPPARAAADAPAPLQREASAAPAAVQSENNLSPEPLRPQPQGLGPRWTSASPDQPGAPLAWLDGDAEAGLARLVRAQSGEEGTLYEVRDDLGRVLATGGTPEEAARKGERRFLSYADMTADEKAAYDESQGITPGRREEVDASLLRTELQNLKTRIQAAGFGQKNLDGVSFSKGQFKAAEVLRTASTDVAELQLKIADAEAMQDGLRRMGHDGITHIGGGRVKGDGKRHRVYIAFDPEQVKSATGNEGAFDRSSPDIRKSQQKGSTSTSKSASANEKSAAAPQFRGPAPSTSSTSTSTADTMRTELRERFGPIVDRLEKRGILKLWDSVDAYNESGQASKLPADARGVQGMYSRGVAHLFGDGVEPGNAVPVFLHEVGEYASMKAMLGPRYNDLVRRAYRLVADGDEIAETAMARIPDDTPAKFQDSELLAYMIEETASREQRASPAARSWLRDVIAAIRAWFYQTGLSKQLERYGAKLELTPKDIAALAVRAVRWQAQQEAPAPRGTTEAMASRKDVAGNEDGERPAGDASTGTDENTGLPLNADGTVTVYHHTSAAQAAEIRRTGTLRAAAEPDVYVTTRRETDTGYGDTAVSVRVAPGQLQIDDEFPNGRRDFRLNVGRPGGSIKVAVTNEPAASGDSDAQLSKRQPFSATGSNPYAGQKFGPQPWTVAEPGTWDNIVRTLQNNKVDMKRVRDAIEERFGRIPEAKDAYLQEELYHGKVAARVEKLHTEYVEPILRKIAVAGKNVDLTLADVNLYLHARHAPERNAAMAAINPNTPNNGALSGMSDADAAKVLADFGRAGKIPALQTIAKDIDTLLADTRTGLVADGLEEAGVVQAWEAAYKHYVPLMRDIDDRPAKGSGFSVRGPEAKRATGSNRQVVDILANIVTQAETAAIRAEKAEVGRALLEMAKTYPNADFWTVDTPPTKPRVNPNTGLVERNAVDPLYQTADNVVMVKEYGATRFIVFNKGNERAVQLARAMKNLEIQQLPKALRHVGAATRFMASLLTQRNPEFWFTNLARDLQGSAIQMNGTEAEGLQGKVLGYLPKALAGMRHVARGTGKNTQWARYAQEMKDAGGTTGYMQIFDNSTERMENLQKEVDRMGQGKADPRRLARSLLEFIDDYNDVIENGMRLAVFQAAREAGVSTERAASIAKNITVNFNRKGNASPWVNSLYMFFNAGVQGTARLTEALATSNKARIVVGGLAGAAFVMDIVNRALAGDDDETKRNRYDLINEFEKSRNWIIMGPDGKYVKVPLPLGFHIFHNAGRLIADGLNRKDPRNASEYGWAFASTVLDAFNPMGNVASVGQLLAPSVADPAVQLAENKNFMGGKVYRDDDMGFGKTDPRPAYQRYFETTPDFWKAASKTLNDVTGGDKVKPGAVNIEPDILRHVYAAITGGPGRALDKTVDTAQATARGEAITPARIPFVHRFLGEVGDRQKDSAYFEDMKRAAKAKDQFDYFVKAGRRQDALEVLKELGDGDVARGRKVIAVFMQAKKDERALNRAIRKLREGEADDTAMQEQLGALKKRRSESRRRVLRASGEPEDE